MTRRQAWLAIGQAFEKYEKTGDAPRRFRGFDVRRTNGLCCAVNRSSYQLGIPYGVVQDMRRQLSAIRSCNSFWFKCVPNQAGKRALVAYFLAAGMEPRNDA